MKYLVKVKVDVSKIMEFGQKLQEGKLDRSCIRGETFCLQEEPVVGFSIWETASQQEFEEKFRPWSQYYANIEVKEIVTPNEAMKLILNKDMKYETQ